MPNSPQSLISNAALITDPTALATGIAGNSWDSWTNNESPYIQGQISDATQAGSAFSGAASGAMANELQGANGLAADAQGYLQSGKQYGQQVDKLGTEAYRAQQRGIAMGDVQQQISNQQGQLERNQARMGVNPSSGRMQALQNQNAISGALGMASAANQSDRNVQKDYMTGLQGMSGLGMDTLKASQALSGSAQKWGALGMDASQVGAKMGIDYGKLSAAKADSSGAVAYRAAGAQNSNAATAAAALKAADAQRDAVGNYWKTAITAGVTPLLKSAQGALSDKVGSALTKYLNPQKMVGTPTPLGTDYAEMEAVPQITQTLPAEENIPT